MDTAPSVLLIIRDAPPATYDAMSAEQRRRSMDEWNAWVDRMAAAGVMHAGHPLESAGRVVGGARGKRVTDGPFAEAKELVGGFFLLSGVDLDQATEIARSCPSLQYGMTIELRPIAGACHVARSLGWETMRAPDDEERVAG